MQYIDFEGYISPSSKWYHSSFQIGDSLSDQQGTVCEVVPREWHTTASCMDRDQ